MTKATTTSRFKGKLLRPVTPGPGAPWLFVLLPKAVSETLPRRGRTTVDASINGHPFQATLEPDGQLSHWLRVDTAVSESASSDIGDVVIVEITPVAQEPEPDIPSDLRTALADKPEALAAWNSTTTIARVDWIHWVTSAKQAKSRAQRIASACDRLASGKARVCCFDQSGFYSKAFCAPRAMTAHGS